MTAWALCRNIKNVSVQGDYGFTGDPSLHLLIMSTALAQDAENDVVFNVFSLLFPWVGQKLNVHWLDPLGGIVLSLYSKLSLAVISSHASYQFFEVIYEWMHTLVENVSD
jgi:divalent metal cation (Fe/Co/Zn/Cd) transporter